MHFCLGLASRATVIDEGQIVYTSTEELKANDNIRRRYPGAAGLFASHGRTNGRQVSADA
jgi:hypothetical protein